VHDLFELAPKPAESREQLNAQQRAAVEHGEGPLLVVAGAGTGKTRVIIERIRRLLEAHPELPGRSIVALTFTEKAAAEIKHRVTRAVGERGRDVIVGTFHSFCTSLLLERNPQLHTLDKIDHWILLRRNLRLLALERYRRLAEPGQFLGDFVNFFSRCQDELVTAEDYDRYVATLAERYACEQHSLAEDERSLREEFLAQQQEVARAYRASDRLLRESNLLTYGMQLLDAVHMLDNDPEFAAQLRQRFRYILVDEFQDTNVAQLELLWRLAADHRNIVAVGDNAQAIYRFRGASFGSFTIFLERFAGVSRGDSNAAWPFVRALVDNYRSTGCILRVAGQVTSFLEASPLLPKKELVSHKPQGEKATIAEFASAEEEARWIAGEVDRLHRAGRPWSDFAVLYRIHAHREELVEALEDLGIPFVIRNLSILNHPLVRDLLAYLRLVAKPWDNIACARVLAAPAWGLEAADLVRLSEQTTQGKPALWDTLQAAQSELPFLSPGRNTDELVRGLTELRRLAQKATVTDLFDALAEWLQLSSLLTPDERRYVDRLAQFIREWQPKSATSRLAEFVEYLDYFAQAGGQINLEQDADDAVQLMTVHAAKGLEFEHVFILRLTNRAFPQPPRKSVLEFPVALMKEELPEGDFHTEEERRLFYVALTRARDQLTLTTVVNKRSKPSVFLEDILSAPALARQNVKQIAPVVPPAPQTRQLSMDDALFDITRHKARVYSRIAAWAAQYRPPIFEPLQLSPSAIDSYLSCPQRYLFSRVWGLRSGPAAATTFGNVMHTTVKQFIGALRKGQRLPFEEVETIFRREWTSAGYEDGYQEESYQRDGIEQLRAFHGTCLASPVDILAQEKAFVLELDHNVRVTGRIDQINRAGRDAVEIVDYKTGKPKTEEAARKDVQLSVYALAAREELDLHPVRLIYYNLQTNQGVAAERNEKQLSEVRGLIQEVAADIRAREFPALPSFRCRTCEFRSLCPAHEARHSQKTEPTAGTKPTSIAAPAATLFEQ
jgi:DNA helicase II / ATP-dependent DNA helicase PcrA